MIRGALYGLTLGLAIAFGAAWWAYGHGIEVSDGRQAAEFALAQAAQFKAAELASRKEADRLALVEANRILSRQYEDQAYADPPAVAECLPEPRRLRLQARVDAANRAATGKP
jgi:hypothetical protein